MLAGICLGLAAGGSGFAANLPFVIIETGHSGISFNATTALISVTSCCPSNEMMATCCSLYSAPDTKKLVSIHQQLDSQGKSSKMGYHIRLRAPATLLGLPAASSFVLNGPHADKTLMRDVLAFNISRAAGMYASRTRIIELFVYEKGQKQAQYPINYRGVYVLEEALTARSGRIPVSKSANDFIFRVGAGAGTGAGPSQEQLSSMQLELSSIKMKILFPPASALDDSTKLFCGLFMNKFEAGFLASNNADMSGSSAAGKRNSKVNTLWLANLNIQSAIDFFLLTEVANNLDGYTQAHLWLRDQRLHIGPVWDFGVGFGNTKSMGGSATSGWRYQIDILSSVDQTASPYGPGSGGAGLALWYNHFLHNDKFKDSVICRWRELRRVPVDRADLVRRQRGGREALEMGLLGTANIDAFIDAKAKVLLAGGGAWRDVLQWHQDAMQADDGAGAGAGAGADADAGAGAGAGASPPAAAAAYRRAVGALKTWLHARLRWMDASPLLAPIEKELRVGITFVDTPHAVSTVSHARFAFACSVGGFLCHFRVKLSSVDGGGNDEWVALPAYAPSGVVEGAPKAGAGTASGRDRRNRYKASDVAATLRYSWLADGHYILHIEASACGVGGPSTTSSFHWQVFTHTPAPTRAPTAPTPAPTHFPTPAPTTPAPTRAPTQYNPLAHAMAHGVSFFSSASVHTVSPHRSESDKPGDFQFSHHSSSLSHTLFALAKYAGPIVVLLGCSLTIASCKMIHARQKQRSSRHGEFSKGTELTGMSSYSTARSSKAAREFTSSIPSSYSRYQQIARNGELELSV